MTDTTMACHRPLVAITATGRVAIDVFRVSNQGRLTPLAIDLEHSTLVAIENVLRIVDMEDEYTEAITQAVLQSAPRTRSAEEPSPHPWEKA